VLEEIKNDAQLKCIPVVVLTTSKAEEDVLKTYGLHANCYVTKPVDLDKFIHVVKSIDAFWCRWSRCRRASAEHEAVEFHFAGRPRRSRLREEFECCPRRGESVRRALAATFPGHTVKLEFQPMGKLVQSLAAGYRADMVIVTSEVLPQLERDGRVAAGGGRPVARVGIGVAVNEKAPLPDISTPEAFKRTLLAARSVVYIDPKSGTSGKHVAEILQRLGIADQVNRKATLGQGGYITEPVGRGEIELASTRSARSCR